VGETCSVGGASGDAGDPAADAGLCRQGAGGVAHVPGGDRGDDLGLTTSVSADEVLLSRFLAIPGSDRAGVFAYDLVVLVRQSVS